MNEFYKKNKKSKKKEVIPKNNNNSIKKIKIEEIATGKKFLAQLVQREKQNENACLFARGSEIGIILNKCKVGDQVQIYMRNEKRNIKVLEIRQE